jgi:hypothetical protein
MKLPLAAIHATAVSLLWIAFVVPCTGQHALTAPRSFAYLATHAGTIVHGSVISARMEKHPQFSNLNTVVVTLRVKETLKGKTGETFTFREYLPGIQGKFGTGTQGKFGAGGYRKGEELLLMLNPTSRYGLSSPVGLEQGRFRILHEVNGSELAVNGHGNAGLFRGMEQKAASMALSKQAARLVKDHQQGPVPLQELREIILQLTRSAK